MPVPPPFGLPIPASSRQQRQKRVSIVSFNHVRSFSDTGPHLERSQSPHASIHSSSSHLFKPNCLVKSPAAKYSVKMASPQQNGERRQTKEQRSTRPRSWFTFPQSSLRERLGRSFSVQLPKETSSSTISRSIISAPVLTGTTNIHVAEAEGVCCRDIVDAGLTAYFEDPKKKTRVYTPRGGELSGDEANRLPLFRVRNVWKNRREKTKSLTFHVLPANESEDTSEDSWRLSAVERGVARRRAETMNLCREKINKLTGHGNIKRKSINRDNRLIFSKASERGNNITALPAHGNHTHENVNAPHFLTLNHSNPDFTGGSLTRSFVSAIDKLDFHSTPIASNMQFFKSKSSIFTLRKRNRNVDAPEEKKSQPSDGKAEALKETGGTEDDKNSDNKTEYTVKEALKNIQPPDDDPKPRNVGAPPDPIRFSPAANDYAEGQPVLGYPRGVKILGMHSNTMDFARDPSKPADLQKQPQEDSAHQTTPDDEYDPILDAPIFSPSLGELKQYVHPPPQSAQHASDGERTSGQDTATQVSGPKGYLRRLGLHKSRSGSGLLGKFSKGAKEASDGRDGRDHVEPLQGRDPNQTVTRDQHLRKSRSMSLNTLFRRDDMTSTTKSSLPEDKSSSSKPAKPSPLRHEAKVENPPFRQVPARYAEYALEKRTPPRGSVTAADRAKRMGVVGMPLPTAEEVNEEE